MAGNTKPEYDTYITPRTIIFENKIRQLIKDIKVNRTKIDQLVDEAIHASDNEISWWGRIWLWNLSKYYIRKELSSRMGDLIKTGLMEDVESEAKEKIIKEADSYDSTKGSILTFARRRALHAMTSAINFATARTSDYFAGNMKKVKKAKDILTKEEKPITLIALVAMTGLQPKKIEDALELLERTTQTAWEAIENEKYSADVSPERKTLEQEVIDALYDAIRELPKEYKDTILFKFGVSDGSGEVKTIKEMKNLMSIPQNQIREYTAKALKKLSENKRLATLRGAELRQRKRNDIERIEPNKVSKETEDALMSYFIEDDSEEHIEDGVMIASDDEVRGTEDFSDVLLGIDFMDQFLLDAAM